MTIKVLINGAKGKMGLVTVAAVTAESDLQLVGQLDHGDSLEQEIIKSQPDVVIDFTIPSAVFANCKTIIAGNARLVVGTSGLTLPQIEELQMLCRQKSLGGIIAPNFSLGAVLMMRYAQDAAKYLPNVEIIEMYHEQKIDAPSGTAVKTAEMIAQASDRTNHAQPHKDRARGEQYQGVTIHSVRLPGLFAHQSVLFGNTGELLTIRHDAMNRSAMMPGVILSCRKVMNLDHLVYGLENIL